MKAAFLTGIRRIDIRQAQRPEIKDAHDVLLRVDVVGVCGSDVHYYKDGKIGTQVVQYPWIIGHEFGATVVEVGGEVKGLKAGQLVAVDPLISCGRCDQCLAGRSHTCRDQYFMGCPGQLAGCMSEYVVMPDKCCLPMPAGTTAVQAALCEPFSIALHARNLAAASSDARIAVLGTGPIGLCVLAALKTQGLTGMMATDLLDNRLELARSFGASWTGNAARSDVAAEIMKLQPMGMNFVFECAGKAETIDQAVQLLAPGGTLVLVGIPAQDRISLDMNDLRRKEIAVQCVRRQNDCVQEAIDMVAGGEVNLDPLVTHHLTLEQSQTAFDLVSEYADGVVKAMVHLA